MLFALLDISSSSYPTVQVGVAFTRFQTKFFQGKYGNLDARLISYGPCQTPTLNFCVERHQKIIGFEPESFWTVKASLLKGGQIVELQWARGRVFDQGVAGVFAKLVRNEDGYCAQHLSWKMLVCKCSKAYHVEMKL